MEVSCVCFFTPKSFLLSPPLGIFHSLSSPLRSMLVRMNVDIRGYSSDVNWKKVFVVLFLAPFVLFHQFSLLV